LRNISNNEGKHLAIDWILWFEEWKRRFEVIGVGLKIGKGGLRNRHRLWTIERCKVTKIATSNNEDNQTKSLPMPTHMTLQSDYKFQNSWTTEKKP
jgi:hypothetical protein